MHVPTVRIAASIPQELHDQVQRLADAEDRSISSAVVRGLRLYVASSADSLVDRTNNPPARNKPVGAA